jgi:hypothetical protein
MRNNLYGLALPNDGAKVTGYTTAAPTVMRLSNAGSVFSKSTTICTLLLVEPSFKAMKRF